MVYFHKGDIMKKDQIVVIDSGLGGLNIYNTLVNQYPNENYVYVADEAYFPYGTKDKYLLSERVQTLIEYFKDAKAIIIACNTASSVLQFMTKQYDNVIGIIELTANHAATLNKKGSILALATNLTIELGEYQKYIKLNNKQVIPVKGSEFVTLVESKQNMTDEEYHDGAINLINKHLKPHINLFDTLICGCTHFGYLIPYFKEVLGELNYVVSDFVVSSHLQQCIELNQTLDNPTRIVYSTAHPEEFQRKMESQNIYYKVELLNI